MSVNKLKPLGIANVKNLAAYLQGTLAVPGYVGSVVPNSAFAAVDSGYGPKWVGTMTDGKSEGIAGYFEAHVAGTPDGGNYALGAWMNVDTTPGGVELRVMDVGMYARGQDLSSTALLNFNSGMHADAANGPSSMYHFRFNCFQTGSTPDGIFRASNAEAVNWQAGASTGATKTGDLPFNINGVIHYLRGYDGVS